jgi:hypothetical protein
VKFVEPKHYLMISQALQVLPQQNLVLEGKLYQLADCASF